MISKQIPKTRASFSEFGTVRDRGLPAWVRRELPLIKVFKHKAISVGGYATMLEFCDSLEPGQMCG